MLDIQQGDLPRNQVYAISVAIPFSHTLRYVSKNILRGVAWKQEEFNNNNSDDNTNNRKHVCLLLRLNLVNKISARKTCFFF